MSLRATYHGLRILEAGDRIHVAQATARAKFSIFPRLWGVTHATHTHKTTPCFTVVLFHVSHILP